MRRCDIDKEFTWDLTSIYQSDEDWNEDFKYLNENLSKLSILKGSLGNSSSSFFNVLNTYCELSAILEKLYYYSNLCFHLDMSNTYYQGLTEKAETISTQFNSISSFINPEILSLDESTILEFLSENKALSIYNHFLNDLNRQRAHILNNEIESIIALSKEIANNSSSTYDMLLNADMTFPIVKDDNGDDIKLTHSKFSTLMYSNNRAIRENAFKQYYKSFENLKNTLSSTYSGVIKSELFYSNLRKYNSSVEMSLSADNIPVNVYDNLISTVNKFLPLLHRYVDLRKNLLGVDELHMYDLYTPIVKETNVSFDYESAKEKCLKGLKPLGDEYISIVEKAFKENWIDVYPTDNKLSGAYSWGIYSNHPRILLNYENKIDDMFTLSHELGHTVHSYMSTKNQDFVNYDYTTFLAEIASTVNETLLMQHLLNDDCDEDFQLYLLNFFLEQFRGSMFRQTLFAEFELEAHKLGKEGSPINTESLNKLYYDLVKKYYGNNIVVDDEIAYEWSRIPHFYTPFYVYQYATGFSCAVSFSKMILEDKSSIPKYLEFLKSGSSNYSLEILKNAGVDMSSPKPITDSLELFETILNKLENLDIIKSKLNKNNK